MQRSQSKNKTTPAYSIICVDLSSLAVISAFHNRISNRVLRVHSKGKRQASVSCNECIPDYKAPVAQVVTPLFLDSIKKENKRVVYNNLLLSAVISIFPSLMSSLMNLLVCSNSISWYLRRSLKSGLSRKESLNSSVGSPIVHAATAPGFLNFLT